MSALAPLSLAALIYLAAANAAAYLAMAVDKQRAIDGARRVPERVLLMLAAIGGGAGAVAAQQGLRHKTRKQPFAAWLWIIAAAQLALAWWGLARLAS